MNHLTFRPKILMQYDTVHLASIDEDTPLSQHATATSTESFLTEIAVRVSVDCGQIHPFARIAWTHDFLDTARRASARLVGIPGSAYLVHGVRPKRDSVQIRAGLAVGIAPGIIIRGTAEAAANDNL